MSGSGDAAPVASTAPSLTDGIGTSDLAVDGLSGLIGRLLEQAEQAQADLSGEFNGERQGLVRGFIDDVGQQLNQSTHDFFQQSVRGEVKGLLMDVVDHSGSSALQQATDPLFAVDYYGASSALINNGLSALPISNLALPQIGPLLTHPQSELAGYLSR